MIDKHGWKGNKVVMFLRDGCVGKKKVILPFTYSSEKGPKVWKEVNAKVDDNLNPALSLSLFPRSGIPILPLEWNWKQQVSLESIQRLG